MKLSEVIEDLFVKIFTILLLIPFVLSVAYGTCFLLFGSAAQGQVTKIEHIHSAPYSKRGVYERTWIDFFTRDEQQKSTFTDSTFNLEEYSLGEQVTVLYFDSFDKYEIKSLQGLYGFSLQYSLIFILGYGYMRIRKKTTTHRHQTKD